MRGLFFCLTIAALLYSCTPGTNYTISGELKQWHKVTLSFEGPSLEEDSSSNPFLDYRLQATFEKEGTNITVPGYFAADGNAAETGASSGNIWRVHFNPPSTGTWNYRLSFCKGKDIAISNDTEAGEAIAFDGFGGALEISASDKEGKDFRSQGIIQISDKGRFFQHADSGKYFLKAGADSPENFLAYYEFDSTYRHSAEARQGEADPTQNLHRYAAHAQDWNEGDPTWQEGKGKNIVGALNYLAGKGMNSVYFLVMNINGDGKDVWPYTSHEERLRFDCSKLDQWEIIFEHMEKLGLMMHLVTQETENELLLDNGNTEKERKLFYRELIARFGHHNALVWNLGEENGPANFSPNGQNNEQQKAMASHLKEHDPYQHPVVIHTHSWRGAKEEGLPGLIGHKPLDGLSFQISEPKMVHSEILSWSEQAAASGHPWLIAMDEIGMWHTGVMPDAVDPDHDTIRSQVLWGSLMAGAAGVEWYFGARYAHNDLTCEDWRSRERMWDQTRYAKEFFDKYLPWWEMRSQDEMISYEGAYCLAKPGEVIAVYYPPNMTEDKRIRLKDGTNYKVSWYDPIRGGALIQGNIGSISGPGLQDPGLPEGNAGQDWVLLLRR